jgi:plastocyanin
VSTDDEQPDTPEVPGASAEMVDESPGTELVTASAATPAPVAASVPTTGDDLRNRFLMPLVLPLTSIFVVVLVALNISRLFLAGGKTQSAAVIVATVLTVGILIGAAALSAAKHVRTSSLVLGLSLVLVLIFSAGLITFGSGEEKEKPAGPAAPTGPAVNTFQVDALPSLSFQATEFSVVAGINQIEYVDKGGTHTLVFSDPSLGYFNLGVPAGPTKGKVELEAGKDYTIYCTISGHRAAGMEAVVHVGAAPAAAPAPVDGASTTTTVAAG